MRYLLAWQHAACECQLKSLKLFKLRPKHHSTDHLAAQMKRTKLNARKVMSCFPDESFLGVLKKIGIKCHSLSVMRRVFQRYLYCTCPFVGVMPECFSGVLCGDRWWAPTGVKKTGFPNDKRNTKPWHHGSWDGMFPLFSVTFWRWWIKTTIPIEHICENNFLQCKRLHWFGLIFTPAKNTLLYSFALGEVHIYIYIIFSNLDMFIGFVFTICSFTRNSCRETTKSFTLEALLACEILFTSGKSKLFVSIQILGNPSN